MLEVTQGEYVELTLKLIDPQTTRPFDLTGYNRFKVCIPSESGHVEITHTANANGSVVAINGDEILGEILAKFYPTDSTLFKTDTELNVALEIYKSTDSPVKPLRKVFQRAIFVIPFEC
jgi:hypothetical protein